jgi:hypothetical protein
MRLKRDYFMKLEAAATLRIREGAAMLASLYEHAGAAPIRQDQDRPDFRSGKRWFEQIAEQWLRMAEENKDSRPSSH